MRNTYQTEQWLPYPVETVFAFFADPRNLPPLMPGWQRARIDASSIVPPPPRPAATDRKRTLTTSAAGAGTTMLLTFRPFPLAPFRLKWNALINEFAWNDHFCDAQTSGPFAFWNHCHHVTADTRPDESGALTSGTLVRDEVEYAFPFGPLGGVANLLGGRLQIRSIFNYRHQQTRKLLPLFVQLANR